MLVLGYMVYKLDISTNGYLIDVLEIKTDVFLDLYSVFDPLLFSPEAV